MSSSGKVSCKGEDGIGPLIHNRRMSFCKCWVYHGNQRVGDLQHLVTLCKQTSSWTELCISTSHQHVYEKL